MTSFIAIDPGLAARGGSGWAFVTEGELHAAGMLRNHKDWKSIGQRVRGQRAALEQLFDLKKVPVVAEHMRQIYRVPAQDLIDLQTLSGHLGNHFVKASEWKGSVPKEVEDSRTLVALSPEERMRLDQCLLTIPKSLHKEPLSAVGIALSVLQRAHKKCGWPS